MPPRPCQDHRRYLGRGTPRGSRWTVPAWVVGLIWIAVSAMHVAYEHGAMWWVWLALGVFWVVALPYGTWRQLRERHLT